MTLTKKSVNTKKRSGNKTDKEQMREELRRMLLEKGRRIVHWDMNKFCEYIIKDEKDHRIIQAAIHKEMQWHIDKCRKSGVYCGILAPWGHGKTEQVAIARPLKHLNEDQNLRIGIVSNSDENARARVNTIAKYIEHDSDYHKYCPKVKPGPEWSKHKLTIKRSSKSKDGSIEAWGITSSGTGSRYDLLIIDDPVDLRNAILNPAMRKQIKQSFYNVWIPRLAPDGFLIYIATKWHTEDLTTELEKNPQYCFLKMSISADFSRIDCQSIFKGQWSIPLFSLWDKARLIQREKEIGKRAFNRGYRQKAISDDEKSFPSAGTIFKTGVSITDIVSPDWPRYTGVDPFGKWVVVFTLAKGPDGKRYPVEIRRGRWQPNETITQILEAYRINRPQIMMVENNAAQEAIKQWAQEKGGYDLPLQSFTTGKQKADPNIGLPSLEVEYANGSWVCALGTEEHEPDCECGYCEWRRELDGHPVYETTDIIMASWFAREGARKEISDTYNFPKTQSTRKFMIQSGTRRIFK